MRKTDILQGLMIILMINIIFALLLVSGTSLCRFIGADNPFAPICEVLFSISKNLSGIFY
ncbi:MAG: hypothetical protein DRP06_00940 [Candidatus Aenigmatarchaeota archaeon]|nr:MAG: hypothetical protein DRP06_00940 [Candidatus Aenigmarchaeota archaeon]